MELIAMVSSFFIVHMHTEFLRSGSYNQCDLKKRVISVDKTTHKAATNIFFENNFSGLFFAMNKLNK